jgi:hypothetical protein
MIKDRNINKYINKYYAVMGVDIETNFLTYRYISYILVEKLPNYTPVVFGHPSVISEGHGEREGSYYIQYIVIGCKCTAQYISKYNFI